MYTTEQETGRTLFNTTTADDAEILLTSLHPFYVYHIKVAAVTVQEGNFTTLSVRTEEAGMQHYKYVCKMFYYSLNITSTFWTTPKCANNSE